MHHINKKIYVIQLLVTNVFTISNLFQAYAQFYSCSSHNQEKIQCRNISDNQIFEEDYPNQG